MLYSILAQYTQFNLIIFNKIYIVFAIFNRDYAVIILKFKKKFRKKN